MKVGKKLISSYYQGCILASKGNKLGTATTKPAPLVTVISDKTLHPQLEIILLPVTKNPPSIGRVRVLFQYSLEQHFRVRSNLRHCVTE